MSFAESNPLIPNVTTSVNVSQWDYQYSLNGLTTPAGVSMQLPQGFSYLSSSLPGIQVSQSADSLYFAIPDGGELSFRITGSSGILTGSYTNYLTGEEIVLPLVSLQEGSIRVVEKSTDVHDSATSNRKNPQSAGFFPVSILFSLVCGVMILSWRQS